MKILICNAGSTSLKFKLWDMPALLSLAEGRVERVGGCDAIYSCRIGAPAVLLGRQGDEEITAEELAGWAGTISYEMLLSATARVPVTYLSAPDGE